MAKINLPVILLKGLVLLPNNEIRLEFDNKDSRNIIDSSELFHDNKLLVVSGSNPLEQTPTASDLPSIGVVAKINHKIELPNGKTRIIITGLTRAHVHEYIDMQGDSTLESIVSEIKNDDIYGDEEVIMIRKLYRELDNYVRVIPYMSNSVLSLISSSTDLSRMTDIVAPNLPISYERMLEYLNTTSSSIRANMILEDIYREKEMFELESQIDSKVKKGIDATQREFIIRERIKAMKEELGEGAQSEIEQLRSKVLELDAPKHIIDRLNKEINKLEMMNASSPEKSVIDNYIHWLLDLPWKNETVDNENLKKVRASLNKSHYGLNDVKLRIIEYLAVKKMTQSLKAPIICLVGPPGVGKTSLAIGVAKAINRHFVKMSVGGVKDVSEIMGHRRTYVGASPGRIIEAMKKAGSVNPLFLIDEIDKMSKGLDGDPANALLEVLDPEQNKFFSDNYIEEEYDLSQVMFIATANNINDIPEALKDRLEIVPLSGYTEYEKLDIAKKHLIPKICKDHGLDFNSLEINDEIILKIIRSYTREAGVRELERQLSKIIRKIVTDIVISNNISSKYIVDNKKLIKYLGKEKYFNIKVNDASVGVVNGLAYTNYGGELLPIEVNYYKGNGNLVLTGYLGDVMKESAQIALSYVKANAEYFGIKYTKLTENDIHIHVPEGAIPKDGPSAGVALTTALISSLTNKKINKSLAMTGEITLRGNVLAIGGLKEKSIGAYRNGVKTIIIPNDNLNDLTTIPKEIRRNINYIPVNNYKDIYRYLYK